MSVALIRFLGAWGFILFSLLAVALVALPLFDRGPERHIRKRPFAAALGIIYFGAFLLAWLVGSQLSSSPASAGPGPRALEERVLPFGPEFPPAADEEGEQGGAADAEEGDETGTGGEGQR